MAEINLVIHDNDQGNESKAKRALKQQPVKPEPKPEKVKTDGKVSS